MLSRSPILTSALFALVLSLPMSSRIMAEPIGLMERYALAADREAMLAELIPGSDDYYFFHCLHYQTTGQLERAETVLKDWLAEHKGRETSAIAALTDRQRLLTYSDSPDRTLEHLIRRLGIKLDHAPPVSKGERRFASRLDEASLAVDRLVEDALRRKDGLRPLGMQHLADRFLSGNTAGLPIQLSDFLQRVDGPYLQRLDELVIQELASRRPTDVKLGDRKAHSFLTAQELQAVAKRVPAIVDDNAFVSATLRHLRPGADSDPSQQSSVRFAYLQRVENYTRTLPDSYSSLKASAIYRLLEANMIRGVFDRDLFVRYLEIPRASSLVHPDWKRRSVKAKLSDNFLDMALLPPIGDEQSLVRAHLEHFLLNADSPDAFRQYLNPDYLSRVFAETKLLFGIGPEERWYKHLTAPQRQQLRDAVELRLAAQNREHFGSDDAIELLVDVKNVDELVVRVYEINSLSYYRTRQKPIDTDIDLDGLIATHETRIRYRQPAVQRHREKIALNELTGRGVWIVDLVGKGVRARALVRRGAIDHVDSSSADGMIFTVIDENRRPIPAATMLVGSREFIADDQGQIVLPPVVDRVSRRAVLSDGTIAQPIEFKHLRETYTLSAGMHLDRTLLQSGGNAEVLIRPRLQMGRTVIAPSSLKQVSVRIVASDLDGLTTSRQLTDLKLNQHAELVVPLRVPARLSALSVTLSGKVERLADGTLEAVETSRNWEIAGIRTTSHPHDAFLTRDEQDYVIEIRGRNGELVPAASVSLSLDTQLRHAPLEHTLQSDGRGRVELGSLPGVTSIRYGVTSGVQHQFDLRLNRVRWPDEVHAVAGQPIRLALAAEINVAERYRLLEIRGDGNRADLTPNVAIEDGLLVIADLEPGDYRLLDRNSGKHTLIAVVDGPEIGSVAVGQTRHREISPIRPIGIAALDLNEGGLRIRLSGETALARVHVYAARYLDGMLPWAGMDLSLPRLYGRRVSLPRCGYVSDLRLGDEYQYVLRRQYATKYPGVMLPQPGVILNPWETEETVNQSQAVRGGDVPPPSAAAPQDAEAMADDMIRQQAASIVGSDFDFLADSGALISNLRPDENGLVEIPADVIEGMPILHVVVSDPANVLQRVIAAPLPPAETTDLRLSKALDAKKPYTFERDVLIASSEAPLDLKSLGSAQLQVYPTVGSLMKLYKTLVGDPRFAEFDQLAVWHTLDQTAKLESYSRLASHELHLFLWSHDRGFFDEVVRPYLENKKEKQFLDEWLLQRDLTRYLKLWRYNQLNAAERVLLAMRLPEVREAVQRELRDWVAEQDEDFVQTRKGIESALRGLSLDAIADTDFSRDGVVEEEMEALSIRGFAEQPKSPARGRRLQRFEKARKLSKPEARLGDDSGLANLFSRRFSGGTVTAFFRELDITKQWAESHWDRVRTVGGPSPANLIRTDAFWSDLANCESDQIRVSRNLLRPIGNRHAALVALAMCGLPLEEGEVDLPREPGQSYAPAHAVAVVTKRLRTLDTNEQESTVLVGQRFDSLANASRQSKEVAPEPTEFLTGVAYRGQTVVSNPTAARRVVDIFWQLPAGSLPLASSHSTDSRTLVLEPFAVQAIDYQFYFPKPGEFVHYPVAVSAEGQLIARGVEKTFRVVEVPSEDDSVSWEKVARTGSAAEITDFLATTNLWQLDWLLVAHRMQDQDVYRAITTALRQARMPVTELWAYSVKHRDEQGMQTYLSLRDDLVSRVGPVFDSALLDVEPIERRMHEILEYSPLVRARIHRLGEQDEILNPTFLNQYRQFVRVLGYSPRIDDSEQLVLSYYLLLQNRIEEAIAAFAKVEREAVETKLQYDYVQAYLAMHQEQIDVAERIARTHQHHPIARWAQRFGALASQLNQRRDLNQPQQLVSVDNREEKPIEPGTGDLAVMDRERRQEAAAQQQPEVVIRVEGDSLKIDHRRAVEATVNLYGVDLELLFSKAPFVREDLQRMAMVKPTFREEIRFDTPTGVARFDFEGDLRRRTLLVEVVAGAARSTALYYGGEMTTYVSESFGQLQTTDASTHRPISAAYVKVYAKYPDGSVRFYKDGYTDTRGRFDYASLSANDAKGATRFALLVLSDEKGATLHDVSAPNR